MKAQILFANDIDSTSKKILEEETNKISELLKDSIKKYTTHENIKFAIQDLTQNLNILLKNIRNCVTSLKNIGNSEENFLFHQLQRISGILNSSLDKYNINDASKIENDSLVVVSKSILNIITEKESEYKNQPIHFRYNFTNNSEPARIKINQSDLERMLSNLINNSVDACKDKNGLIDINLSKETYGLKIVISDNGCGIPEEVIAKINSNQVVTSGKKNGQGIGYKQIRETLAKNNAKLSIQSNIQLQHTTVTIDFPILGSSK